ncbi:MAG: hypothetical protein DPW16_15505 [Chloroflexi bacterium]|nr:hypothetical protein [Chloroflexota bacterium]
MTPSLEIRALGGLNFQVDGQVVSGFETRKTEALLVYLACTLKQNAREAYSRDELAEIFWEYSSASQAKDNLRVALVSLKKRLPAFMNITHDDIGLNPASAIWLDTLEFERRLVSSSEVDHLESALELYRGDFLVGFFVDSSAFDIWATLEREHWKMRAINALDTVVVCYLETGNYPAGIARATALLQMDQLREESYRRLMELLWRSGERTAALQKYDSCREILQKKLDIVPSPEITELYERIRRGELPPSNQRPTDKKKKTEESPLASAVPGLLIHTENDVPLRPEFLFGRTDLLAQLHELLNNQRRVLLQGFSGIGKTVLAAEATARWVAEGHTPVLWLVARDEPVGALLEAMARPFDAHREIAVGESELRLQKMRSLLAEAGIKLVVIDDAQDGRTLQQIMQAIPIQVPVLVTSRQRIPVGPILNVTELTPPDAMALLNYHANRTFLAHDDDAQKLCRRLGFHPFALEIAGKTLLVDDLTPAELLNRFGKSLHLMTMPAWFANEGRESIKELMDASIASLDPSARDVFLAFGALFTTTATSDLLALCLNKNRDGIEALCSELQRRGLVERLGPASPDLTIYRVHDLAYSYARANSRLSQTTVIAACRECAARHTKTLTALDAELGNLLGAAYAAYETHLWEELVEIMRLLAVDSGESGYFASRGYSASVLYLMRLAIEAAKAEQWIEPAHYLLGKYGDAYAIYLGNLAQGLEAYHESLEFARLMGNSNRIITLLTLIGTTEFQQGSDPEHYYEEAYALARDHNDDNRRAYVLSHRSFYEGRKTPPNYENSRRCSDEAVEIATQLNLHEVHFMALINRGNCERILGWLELALVSDQDAYRLAHELDNKHWMADALMSLGEDYDAVGARDKAQYHFEQAYTLWKASGATSRIERLLRFMRKNNYTLPPDSNKKSN